jgi:SET domain-containing protein
MAVNHSCDPNVGLVLPTNKPREWGVEALRDIKKGEDLTFFYPSTEWDMAQGFDCSCGAKVSLGTKSQEKKEAESDR